MPESIRIFFEGALNESATVGQVRLLYKRYQEKPQRGLVIWLLRCKQLDLPKDAVPVECASCNLFGRQSRFQLMKKPFSNMLCVNLDVTNPWAVRGGWPFDSGLSTGVDESKQRRLMDISKQAGAVKGPLRGPKFARKSV
jgi:hypothetical protein